MPPYSPPQDNLALARRAIPMLTTVQNCSALSFSVFALLHLGSPFSAAFAPAATGWNRSPAESAATAWQMLGRVVYRDSKALEATLVWGSLAVHLASGAIKRRVREWERNERRRRLTALAEESAAQDRFTDEGVLGSKVGPSHAKQLAPLPLNAHQLAGYALVPFVAHHIWTHRILPFTLPNALSSSLMSYQLPSFLLSSSSPRSPILPWISYGALLLLGSYHFAVGLRVIADPTGRKDLKPGQAKAGESAWASASRWVWSVGAGVGLVGCFVGLARMASEGKHIPAFISSRYVELAKRAFPL